MDPTLTRKQYLEKKYREFTTELSDKLCEGIFPSLDECCMVIFYYIFNSPFVIQTQKIMKNRSALY